MANHAVDVELFYDSVWNSAPSYSRDGIALSRGAPGEGQDTPPSSSNLTLDNRDGKYNPRNPNSTLFGLAGRNTPMRVTMDGSVRSTTEISSWAPRRSIDRNSTSLHDRGDAWTEIGGGGLLRRIQAGKTPLKSPIYRAVLRSSPAVAAWWPLEAGDGQATTSTPSGLSGGSPMIAEPASAGTHRLSGVVGGTAVGPPGAAGAIDLSGGGQLRTTVTGLTSTHDAWRFEMSFQFTEPVDALESGQIVRITTNLGTLYGVFCIADLGIEFVFEASDADTNVGETTSLILDDGAWHHLKIEVNENGSNSDYLITVDGSVIFNDVASGIAYALPTEIVISPTGDVDTASQAILWTAATQGALPDADYGYDAFTGYAGETAGERFLRIGVEEDLNTIVVGDETDTQAMGAQPTDTLVNILRECVKTDDGLMYEPRDELGIVMRTGRDLLNQSVAMTISYTDQIIAPELRYVIDDQQTRNDVTVERRGGGSARAVQETGPLNVQNPVDDPDGVGRYDVKVDVNTETDDVLAGLATWHLHKGTVDEPRYPQVTIDLDAENASSSVITSVNALEIGNIVQITDLPTDWSSEDALLLVVGIRESSPSGAGDYRRKVTLVTVPASPYEVSDVGDDNGSVNLRGQAIDTDNSTLNTGINAFTGTLSVASTGGTLWTTSSTDWSTTDHGTSIYGGGLFIIIGGEVMRVTNITGASSPQTFTVVRSINGIVKSHLAGAPVHVRFPAVVAP